MKKSYYLLNVGRLSRKNNTLFYDGRDENGNDKRLFIPVETIEDIFILGNMEANSALYEFLGKKGINVHFFDHYQNYCGSFFAKDEIVSGQTIVQQALCQQDTPRRLYLARTFLQGAFQHIRQNLKYYEKRGKSVTDFRLQIEDVIEMLHTCQTVPQLMGLEGHVRHLYYQAFDQILLHFRLEARVKRPPNNPVNSLISYGNMVLYAVCTQQIFHTALQPSIGFLHEPAERRPSLALDIAEIFKPLIVDKVIFSLLNHRRLQQKHFLWKENGQVCWIAGKGKRIFIEALQKRLQETFFYRPLKRHVSYRQLIRLECHKVLNYVRLQEQYKVFKAH